MEEAKTNPGALFDIDLDKQTVTRGNTHAYSFEIEPFRKHCLLNGLDDVGLTLQKEAVIANFENTLKSEKPWI